MCELNDKPMEFIYSATRKSAFNLTSLKNSVDPTSGLLTSEEFTVFHFSDKRQVSHISFNINTLNQIPIVDW